MDGRVLTLGAAGALALANVRQRGSAARAPKIPDLSLDAVHDGQRAKLGERYTIANPRDPARPLRFDPRYEGRGGEGLGAVSDNANVDYLGFVVWMTPTEFLRLSPALRMDDIGTAKERATDIAAAVVAGASLGPPFLVLDDWKVGASRSPPVYRVRSHEGRHRVHAIRMLAGEVVIPVHVFGSFRARAVDYPPRRLAGAVLLPDPRVAGNEPVTIGAFCVRGTIHVPEGLGSMNTGVRAPTFLWHGTSQKRLPDLIRDGIRSPSWWGSRRMATWFAEDTADQDDSTPALIAVPLKRFNTWQLEPDEMMIKVPILPVLGTDIEIQDGRTRPLERRVQIAWAALSGGGTWEDSLRIVEAVVYRAPARFSLSTPGPVRITRTDVRTPRRGNVNHRARGRTG